MAPHYGDPVGEQRAWVAGTGYAWLDGAIGVLRVGGAERLGWLDSLTSASLGGMAPGDSAETLLLDATGRIEHAFGVVETADAAFLTVPAVHAEAAQRFLDSMRFALHVSVSDMTADVALLATPGPAPLDGAWAWDDPWPGVVPGGTSYGPAAGHPGGAWRLRLTAVPAKDRAAAGALLEAAGLTPVGTWALNALRLAAWRPWVAAPGVQGALPHELDWLRTAVHLHKGCYRGQETVAKVHNVGRPPRRLVFLHLDGSPLTLPAPGALVALRDAEAAAPLGAVTSAARHHILGPIALALVKRGTDPAAELVADGVPAAQQVIVPPSGESADRPTIGVPQGTPTPGSTRPGALSGRLGSSGSGGTRTNRTPGGRGIGLRRQGSE
ncbi:MAG: hypothetical protein LBJ08_11880 [Bifidobacteriaceae bacterium]|nr:hypothetical protein [Bifidobacteriaceae bacterium]